MIFFASSINTVSMIYLCFQWMDNKDREVVGPELAGKIHQRSHSANSVAKVISNIKMTNPIKKLVSQRRKRYTKDGFNLDLTCILC